MSKVCCGRASGCGRAHRGLAAHWRTQLLHRRLSAVWKSDGGQQSLSKCTRWILLQSASVPTPTERSGIHHSQQSAPVFVHYGTKLLESGFQPVEELPHHREVAGTAEDDSLQ